jgi:hypothetical protein
MTTTSLSLPKSGDIPGLLGEISRGGVCSPLNCLPYSIFIVYHCLPLFLLSFLGRHLLLAGIVVVAAAAASLLSSVAISEVGSFLTGDHQEHHNKRA